MPHAPHSAARAGSRSLCADCGPEYPRKEREGSHEDYLLKLQELQKEVAREQTRQMWALQSQFEEKFDLVYQERKKLVASSAELERFWMHSLMNHELVAGEITRMDQVVLSHLQDITTRSKSGEEQLMFKLQFHFSQNPYFTDKVLSKTWSLDLDLIPTAVEGCDIQWRHGKDVTMRLKAQSLSKPGGGVEEVMVPTRQRSFFHCFYPKRIPSPEEAAAMDDDELMAIAEQVEHDYAISDHIRTEIIPSAINLFLFQDSQGP